MRRPKPALSREARTLLLDGSGRWEYVLLKDGPAAQGMILGVRAKPPPDLLSVLEEEPDTPATPDPDQRELF